ncbi:hypothetical protein ACTXGL_11025 [Psychrobacter sp. T6-6]|uniref:hypothetical protein n=1 Tax=Psychrobacter sp. T6-6 TaxID=3457452 RepID=UPI003FD0B5B1
MKNTKQRNIFISVVGLVIVTLGWTYIDGQNSQSRDYEYEIMQLEATIEEYKEVIESSKSEIESLQSELADVRSTSNSLDSYKIELMFVESKSEVDDLAYKLSSDVDDLQREIQEVESIADDVQYKLESSDLQYSY